jgi:hypothetical protein
MDTLSIDFPSASQSPWSVIRLLDYPKSLHEPGPFTPFGSAVSSVASEEGDIYIHGGWDYEGKAKGGLWRLTAGGESISCSLVVTNVTAKTPGPRARHAGLLVGNTFIIFGGEGSLSVGKTWDDTLYLFNTRKDLSSMYKTRSLMTLSLTRMVSSET